jgi:hypothetical protein
MSAAIRALPDGRLHLNHGPIDCIVQAWGAAHQVRAAYAQVARAFADVLPGLCAELAVLRQPVGPALHGPIAARMRAACLPFAADHFITPMAAVAGAVADHLLAALCKGRVLDRAFVNDGGDIAFHLAPGASLACGLVSDVGMRDGSAPHPVPLPREREPTLASGAVSVPSPSGEGQGEGRFAGLDGTFLLTHDNPARGIATSGAGGRSLSLGIADSVTVLAHTAAAADAAATLIGNAVDLPGHAAIMRVPATALDPDSDLGDLLVTRLVGPLTPVEITTALAAGRRRAEALRGHGSIHAAVLALRGRIATTGLPARTLAA